MSRYPKNAEISSLREPFRTKAFELMSMCPWMMIHEANRTNDRQDYLFEKTPKVTNARGGQSAHNYGCAIDAVLNPKHVLLPTRRANGKDWPSLWDRSSEATGSLWLMYGQCAEELGLVWGGRWGRLDEFGLGFDLPHVEDPDWKRLRVSA